MVTLEAVYTWGSKVTGPKCSSVQRLLDEAVKFVHVCGDDAEIFERVTHLGSVSHSSGDGPGQEVLVQHR